MERGNLVAFKGTQEHAATAETTVWVDKGNGSLIIEHPEGFDANVFDADGFYKLDVDKKYLLVLEKQVEPLNSIVELPVIEVAEENKAEVLQVEQPITIKHRKAVFANPNLDYVPKINKPEKEIITENPVAEITEEIDKAKKDIELREEAMKELAENAIASNIFLLNEKTDVYHVLGRAEYDMTTREHLPQFLGNTPEYAEFTKDLLAQQESLIEKLERIDGISKKNAEQLAYNYVTEAKLKEAINTGTIDSTKKIKKLLSELF
jgi:hypothetical protein